MNKVNKKGFTIVELVIVLAVIGILAGILIPTFANVIRKSQISADVQLAKNLNTVLATAAAEGRIPTSMYDVLYLENEAGYIIENLNPTNQDYYFAWDSANNKIVYLMDDLVTVYYPEEYKLDTTACWITVGSAEEAQKVAEKGYNLALERNIIETIELTNVVSIDTLGFTAKEVRFNVGDGSLTTAETTVTLTGNFTSIGGEIGAATVTQSGSASTIALSGSATSSITVGGFVENFSSKGSVTTVSSTGMISTVSAESNASIVNNGVVKKVSEGSSSQVTGSGSSTTLNNKINIGTKEDIESIRTQLSSGERDFSGETITLSNDINMSGIAFQPMSNNNRSSRSNKDARKTWFKGTFDGAGYSIIGFSNNGFSIKGLNAGTNDSSVSFGIGSSKAVYNEAVYGLFGTVYASVGNPVIIKNLNVSCDINMQVDSASNYVGDSVGGIIGFAFGDGKDKEGSYVQLENCTVSGSITGYDGVGGFIGRAYETTVNFINCTNSASVTGVRKTAGFCGSSSKAKYNFTNCVNSGNITCLAIDRDIELVAYNCSDGEYKNKLISYKSCVDWGYYKAAAGFVGEPETDALGTQDLQNTGVVRVLCNVDMIPKPANPWLQIGY